MNPRILLTSYSLGLILIGILRWASLSYENLSWLSGTPTISYVILSTFTGINLVRSHVGWVGIGFKEPFKFSSHITMGFAGAVLAKLAGHLLEPLWIFLFGAGRDLSRFTDGMTFPGLLGLIAFSWVFAAFGEEFAFRGLLMRGLQTVMAQSQKITAFIYLFQAVVFGLVHAYQGPAGVAGATISGLIFGGLVLVARGAIWPSIIAHGLSNTYGLISLWMLVE